ncbi:MAG: hypothetical protein A3G32_07290 [Deltaproteobacteria bacterium RIFCSPLOWO2_12_FULL_40_28]|nr:MAG: hypothetical protein A3C45_07335 [Deltaproteobacteria bacterium RIFCSPHIGHO2_02_FULL_40_28]OGQ19241.1 MAG: hypothetical protein A3E27_04480 [Deltaproteobacteria bacterium RIFCSPHIGHO2_12_FULL_40_32]OGQ40536.1 MAG: hypothetical protein A3I69_00590 [Deltaproteobacteria bacterium RIFCSPLOWO2_02_FULL_40_36]OGQ53771.1 MAG: hypothetical protein A3G32_07290 [Deltaproteobacteria bacterium RIFCSPLOWO2_12_FULL_40_28]
MGSKRFSQNGNFLSFVFLAFVLSILSACGGGSGDSSSSSSSCAEGSNDFYVVENGSCTSGEGKLSRINPDDLCKEEILTDLNCPVDFVLSTVDSGIGYLSSQTDGIFQVDLNAGTATEIVTTTTIVAPAGLFLLESITEAEREGPCGGNTLVDAILMIADEGTELDGGMIWRWCLITDDPDTLASGLNPSPVSEISPAQIEHPRGVVIIDRTQVYATGHNPDVEDTTLSALLATWVLDSGEVIVPTFLTDAGDFSGTIQDLIADADGTLLIADPGQDAVLRYDVDADTLTTISDFTGGPHDILQVSTDLYLVSQFDDNVVSSTTMVDGAAITTATTGITLSSPEGIAQ